MRNEGLIDRNEGQQWEEVDLGDGDDPNQWKFRKEQKG